MNKKFKYGDDYAHLLIKLSRIMRLTILIFVLGINSLLAESSYSQMTRITIKAEDTRVEDVLNLIENKSEFFFLFNQKLIDLNRKVSIDAKEEKISDILDELFAGTDVKHQVIDRQIILTTSEIFDNQQQSNRKVFGKVTDRTGAPLPGASVVVKGTTTGVITDNNGNFSLSLPVDAKSIAFSFVGMKSQEVNIVGKTSINIIMEEETVGLDEVVAIGYGTQKKATLTGAISNMKTDGIINIPSSNLSNVLAGRLSGTFIRSTTGTPGISSDVRVRQNGSWNTAEPLYVIDGIARDKISFDALDPNEVEEITILKDAASTAIYGSRAGNGVILVSTKKGKEGKVRVEYNSVFSAENPGKLPKYMEVEDALKTAQRVLGGISDEEIAWVLKNNPKGENMYNAAYSDPNNQKHSISITGGSDKVSYFLGASYFDENGFLPNVWYKKYNLRANISAKVSKDLTVGLNLSNSYGTRNRFNFSYDGGSADLNSLWGKLIYWDVWNPPYTKDNKPTNPGWLGNPIEMMRNGGNWRNNNQLIDALLSIDYNVPFVKGLSLKASYSRNMDNSFTKDYAKKQLLYDMKKTGPNNLIYTDEIIGTTMSGDPGTEYIGNSYTKTDAYQLNGQINFDRHFGNHYVNATAVYEQYEYKYNNFAMYRNNFMLFPTDQFFAASKDPKDWSTGGSEDQSGRLSYVGRVNYEYASKYLISASVRRDGSVKFAPGYRWGWFPSASAGWIVSEEEFYKKSNLADYVDKLKLRASFGSTGNDAIGGWQWLEQYNVSDGAFYLGNPGATTAMVTYGGTPNPSLTWETTRSYNIGLDARLWRKVDFSLELWKSRTTDILGNRSMVVPSEYGASLPASNYGIAEAKGIEVEMAYRNKIGNNFTYDLKATFGYATTKTILMDHASNGQWFENPEGRTRTYGTGYQAAGILRTQADLDALPDGYKIFGASPELGMMNFADLNGVDGKPDGKIDGYDKVIMGNYMGPGSAPYSFGLNVNLEYKGFTLDALFAGLAGFKISYNDAWGRNYGGGGKTPWYHHDSWSEENPNGTTPKLFPWGDARANGYIATSAFNVYRGDFIRLKNLQLGYNLPASALKTVGIGKAKIFVSGTNLFCWSKFDLYDPEISGFMSYPIMKTYSLGLNVQF